MRGIAELTRRDQCMRQRLHCLRTQLTALGRSGSITSDTSFFSCKPCLILAAISAYSRAYLSMGSWVVAALGWRKLLDSFEFRSNVRDIVPTETHRSGPLILLGWRSRWSMCSVLPSVRRASLGRWLRDRNRCSDLDELAPVHGLERGDIDRTAR